MNKFSKSLVTVLLLSSMAASFAHAIPTANDIVDCVKLRDQAETHDSLSIELRELTSDIHSFSEDQAYRTARKLVGKFYLNLQAVRKIGGITDKSDGLDRTRKLMKKVIERTITGEPATTLMMEKLQELDEELENTIPQIEEDISGCRLRAREARSTTDSSSDEAVN